VIALPRNSYSRRDTIGSMLPRRSLAAAVLLSVSLFAEAPRPVARITAPKDALGFNVGDDYSVANYSQLTAYWKKLASESNRMKLVDIGPTAEGRHQYMAIVSSPQNLAKLERYRDISRRLALAEGLTEEQARTLTRE